MNDPPTKRVYRMSLHHQHVHKYCLSIVTWPDILWFLGKCVQLMTTLQTREKSELFQGTLKFVINGFQVKKTTLPGTNPNP